MLSGDAATNPGGPISTGSQQADPAQPMVSDQIMARRLKNRERQRRYRARKRLEIDTRRSSLLKEYVPRPTLVHFGIPYPDAPLSAMRIEAIVFCGRKWKKEARGEYKKKEPAKEGEGGLPHFMERPQQAERSSECLNKRDWKADARSMADMGPTVNV